MNRKEQPGWGKSEPPEIPDGIVLGESITPLAHMETVVSVPIIDDFEASKTTQEYLDKHPEILDEAKLTGKDLILKKISKNKWEILTGLGIVAFGVAIGAIIIHNHQKSLEEQISPSK
jgi:hypothetical protein